MATPAFGARVEDIEDEIVFQQTLLDTLDQDADSYENERERLEAVLAELEARMVGLTGSGNTYTQAGDESQASTYGDSSQDSISVPAYLGTSLISVCQHKFACSHPVSPPSLPSSPDENFSNIIC